MADRIAPGDLRDRDERFVGTFNPLAPVFLMEPDALTDEPFLYQLPGWVNLIPEGD